jgi:probable rRNA maturation factor
LISAEKKLVIFRKRIAGLSRSTLERFVSRARRAVRLRDTVNVLVTNSRELRSLNRRFRGADKSTDVLSFPSPPANLHAQRVAGEVAISADIARDNANALGHSLAEEVKILVLHGVLHLAGFDHEHDRGEMARKESQLRRRLKLQGSLIERAAIERAAIERATTERAQLRGTRSVTGRVNKVRKSRARRSNP